MAFDPSLPLENTLIDAAQMRAQLQGLNDLIEARVTEAGLQGAIAGTSSNSNGVGTLDFGISDPPTQSEVQTMLDKINELINALRR